MLEFQLSPVFASLNPAQQTVCLHPTTACWLTNSNIQQRTTLNLNFVASAGLASGSMIIINFPVQYTNIPSSGVSATIKQNPLISKSLNTYIVSGITVVTYPEVRMVALTIPGMINAGESVNIALLNFTNPSYIDASGYISYYSINTAKQVQDKFITDNIFLMFSFSPLKFSTNPVINSNSFALGSSVTMSLNASLNIDLEFGTSLKIKMPASYPALSSIIPAVSCFTNFNVTCVVSADSLIISAFNTISANTNILIVINSLINPSTAILVPQTSSGLTITALDSSNRIIAYSIFPSYRIIQANPVLRLQANISSSFYESGVVSSYTFVISTMQTLPSGGTILITFPNEFPDLPTDERCFTGGVLTSINYCTIGLTTVSINTNVKISRYMQFNITIGGITNPSVNSKTLISPFDIRTYYSGNLLDQLDTNDLLSRITINSAPAGMTVVSSSFNPQNEGEIALYTFIVENPQDIGLNDDISFMVQFPIDYPYQLIPADINIYCDSTPGYSSCYISFPRTVVFRKLSQFTATRTMTFNIYSITNPVKTTTHKFNLLIYDNINNTVTAFDSSIDFQIVSLPGILNMSSVSSSSLITYSTSNYIFAFTLQDIGIKQNGGIYISWPRNYYYLFTTSYACLFTNSTDPSLLNPTCEFLVQSGNRTSVVTLTQVITPIGQELFLNYKNMPTLLENGNSGNFIIRIFDNDLESISIRSYPNLTPYPNLDFINIGYRIFINTSEISVYSGSYSLPILLSLEKPTYNVLTVTPVPGNSDIGVVPSVLTWQYAWDTLKTFTLYVPASVNPGTVLLFWVQTEQNNSDPNNREYKPLENIIINVKAPGGNMPIMCDDISYIPLSGTSLPVSV